MEVLASYQVKLIVREKQRRRGKKGEERGISAVYFFLSISFPGPYLLRTGDEGSGNVVISVFSSSLPFFFFLHFFQITLLLSYCLFLTFFLIVSIFFYLSFPLSFTFPSLFLPSFLSAFMFRSFFSLKLFFIFFQSFYHSLSIFPACFSPYNFLSFSPFLFSFSRLLTLLFIFPRSVQNRSSANTTPPSHSSSTWRSRTSTRPCKRRTRTFRSTASSRTRRDARTQPWWTSWTRRSAIWRGRSKRQDSGTTRLQSSRLITEELTWGEGTTGLCAEKRRTCGREGCVERVSSTARCFKPRARRPEGWCMWATGTQPSSTRQGWLPREAWTAWICGRQ